MIKLLSKIMRPWRQPDSEMLEADWDYEPQPPYLLAELNLNPQTLQPVGIRRVERATTTEAACIAFAERLPPRQDLLVAVIDNNDHIVLAYQADLTQQFHGCAAMFAQLAHHHHPVDVAIYEIYAYETKL